MIDLANINDVHRLRDAIDACRDAKRPYDLKRVDFVREYAGFHYTEDSAPFEVLVNTINTMAEVFTIGLAATNPKCRVTTPFRQLRPFAHSWTKSLNNFIREMQFASTMREVILDAIFTFGVTKTYYAAWSTVQLADDVWADPGRTYVKRISPIDFGMDLRAKSVRDCRYMWDEYQAGWADVQEDQSFERRVVAGLYPDSYDPNDSEGRRLTNIKDEYEDAITLMDVWLPEINAVAVFAKQIPTLPLKIVPCPHEGGPYDILGFGLVPDNVLALSPTHNVYALHMIHNGLLRKQARQAQRQKSNPIYRANAVNDANRLMKVKDGVWVQVNDPKAVGVLNQGGVDQASVAFGMGIHDLAKQQVGNLDAMAGLGPQAGTFGQEQLIHSAVSRKEAKMQERVHEFVVSVLGKVGHLMWDDAALEVPAEYEAYPGTGVYRDASWTPERREGDKWQYNFDIEYGSMNYVPAEARVEKFERAMDKAMALSPAIEATGGMIDVQEMFKQYAELMAMEEIEDWIVFSDAPSVQRPGPSEGGAPKPANTTRNYVRRNVATGGSMQNRSSVMQQALLGAGQTREQLQSVGGL